MKEADTGSASPFSPQVIGILIAVATVAFAAVMVLAGWAPELRDRNRAGEHPYSTSALGFNGFVQLLEAQGYPVRITLSERDIDQRGYGVMILTLPAYASADSIKPRTFSATTLLVLPKWSGWPDPLVPERQADTEFIDAASLNDLLEELFGDATIVRVSPDVLVETSFGQVEVRPDVRLQLLSSDFLETIAGTPNGALVAYDPSRNLYVLSDPDMFNTFGLARRENARFAVQLIDSLRTDLAEPILFDATLHGFERSENLLKLMFSIPFLGATLTALASAILLGWGACMRFGPPVHEGRAIALGKQALADNSAGLVTMARREARLAPSYLALVRRRTAREIGLPKGMTDTQLAELFDRLGNNADEEAKFSDLEVEMRASVASRSELMNKARRLYRWRREILRRHMNERNRDPQSGGPDTRGGQEGGRRSG